MNLEIACLSLPDSKSYALRFGLWGTFDISSSHLVTVLGLPSDTERHRRNARLITWQKEHNIRFSELWRICAVVDFPLDFRVVFTTSIIMIRFRYIIESCQSFQTVFFSGLRNISHQILHIAGQVWNEGSSMLCQRLPSPLTTTRRLVLQNLPSLGLPALIRPLPIWRVLNKLHCERLPNNEALQWVIYYQPKASYELYCAIILSV